MTKFLVIFCKKLNLNLSRDIGIDLGTCTVLVHVDGKGIVLNEPSVVAMDTTTDKVVKVGKEALAMIGRTPDHITTMRPLKNGVISQYDVTLHMLQYFIRRACGNTIFRPRVMIGVPTGITEVEERAVLDAAAEAGARRTFLIEEPKAALMGAGVDINSPIGNMVIDVGGGTTDIAVVAMGGIVVSESVKIAGDKFDQAIMQYVRRQYNLLIGERTAEAIKKHIGAYAAVMNGLDAIVFTGGIGENSPKYRKYVCDRLGFMGVKLDEAENGKRGEELEISTPDSTVKVYVIPTNEELVIARDTKAIVDAL